MVKDVCPLPGAGQNRLFTLPTPLAPHGEGAKALPVVRIATKKLFVCKDLKA